MHNSRRYASSNWYKIYEIDAVLNLALSCGVISRHRENRNIGAQLVHPVHNSPKIFWKIYFLYDFLVRTNLFVPSNFWTPNAKFDNFFAAGAIWRSAEKNYIDAHLRSLL